MPTSEKEPIQARNGEIMPINNSYTIRCHSCNVKNRIPTDKIQTKANCGKCGTPLAMEALNYGEPVVVTDDNFDHRVLRSPLPVLVYCMSTYCPGCQTVGPIVDEFARDAKGRVRVAKLNIQNSPMKAAKYNVMSVPFLLVFDGGRLKKQFPASTSKHDLMLKMAQFI